MESRCLQSRRVLPIVASTAGLPPGRAPRAGGGRSCRASPTVPSRAANKVVPIGSHGHTHSRTATTRRGAAWPCSSSMGARSLRATPTECLWPHSTPSPRVTQRVGLNHLWRCHVRRMVETGTRFVPGTEPVSGSPAQTPLVGPLARLLLVSRRMRRPREQRGCRFVFARGAPESQALDGAGAVAAVAAAGRPRPRLDGPLILDSRPLAGRSWCSRRRSRHGRASTSSGLLPAHASATQRVRSVRSP